MTDAQLFQLIGIVYTAVGLGMLFNTGFYKNLIDSFADSPAVTYITALIVIVLGFLLVTFHNVWVMDWPVIITVFGYSALIKGITLLVFPRPFLTLSKAIMKKAERIRIYAVIVLILGLGLMYLGFIK